MDKAGCLFFIVAVFLIYLFQNNLSIFWAIIVVAVIIFSISVYFSNQKIAKKKKIKQDLINKGYVKNTVGMYERGQFNHMEIVKKDEYIEVRFNIDLLPIDLRDDYKFYFNNILKHRYSYEEDRESFEDFDFVERGDRIATLKFDDEVIFGSYSEKSDDYEKVIHKYGREGVELTSPSDGYIVWNKPSTNFYHDNIPLKNNEILYCIYDANISNNKDDLEKAKSLANFNIPNITKDEFNDSFEIKWNCIGGSNKNNINEFGVLSLSEDLSVNLALNFIYENGISLLAIQTNLKIKQGDFIEFLFEDNDKLRFVVSTKPYVLKDSFDKGVVETKLNLSNSDLDKFVNTSFKKWKITLTETGRATVGGDLNYLYFRRLLNTSDILQSLASDFRDLMNQYVPEIDKKSILTDNKKNDESCSVYIMLDKNTKYYKIGISNNPKYREKTLQSEKPTIDLIISKEFPKRELALAIEKALHNTYASSHIRGEWYALSEQQLEDIKASLK